MKDFIRFNKHAIQKINSYVAVRANLNQFFNSQISQKACDQIVHNFLTYFLYFSAKFVLIIAIIAIIILINKIEYNYIIAKSVSINCYCDIINNRYIGYRSFLNIIDSFILGLNFLI